MHHQFLSKRTSPVRSPNQSFLTKLSLDQIWNIKSQISSRSPAFKNIESNRHDFTYSSPQISSLNAVNYISKVKIDEVPQFSIHDFQKQHLSMTPTLMSKEKEHQNEEQHKIKALEHENKILQREYMKISKKYVQLTEQYVLINQKLQEKQTSQNNKDSQFINTNGKKIDNNIIQNYLKQLISTKPKRGEMNCSVNQLNDCSGIIQKLKQETKLLRKQLESELKDFKKQCLEKLKQLEDSLWVQNQTIANLKGLIKKQNIYCLEENNHLTLKSELINLEKGDLLFYSFELEEKISELLKRESTWKNIISIFSTVLCKHISKSQIIQLISQLEQKNIEWIKQKINNV